MRDFLDELGIEDINSGAWAGDKQPTSGALLASVSPSDGKVIAQVKQATLQDYEAVMHKMHNAFDAWRATPAPKRGEIVRQMGLVLRAKKQALGKLVSYEMGKILVEGEGEVQEMIDMVDLAVGLSRQLYGLTIPSERPQHRMAEVWHPLGGVGIITAFNFPVAVWAWNAFLAAVCGDVMLWKPSHKTPLCAVAVQKLMQQVLGDHGHDGVMALVIGETHVIGERMLEDARLPLISATGSCKMGARVGQVVAQRFGKTILELGGNNAIIVMEDANLDLATRAVLFGSVGTAGQRCTSTRRLFLHEKISDKFLSKLVAAYKQVRIGDPLKADTLMGPLIDLDAVSAMQKALDNIRQQGGEVVYGGQVIQGCYVEPAIVLARSEMPMVSEETFAPILYVLRFSSLDEAVAQHNSVPQGLSSAIFTESLRYAEHFLSARGSDCGIANVNIGTSGAEIGGAFGGEKATGGGREAGSDAWKLYMRRQTQTINGSQHLPLAQGITFG
jgi:aldehyde dehydrogenase (NAD+)